MASDRLKAMVELSRAGSTIVPERTLTTAKEIRYAIRRNIGGGNYGVYCHIRDTRYRVFDVRTRAGVMQVRTVDGWVVPVDVFVAG